LARLRGFQKLTAVEDALSTFLRTMPTRKPSVINVSLDSALGRVLAEPLIAEEDLPGVDRSAVDGYAVRAEDTVGASQFKPKLLALKDKDEIARGQAWQLWTGNSIPKGADAVVMLENTKRATDKIEVWTPLAPGDNISKKGEDLRKGEIALEVGVRLRPQHLGLMAALGVAEVKVFEKPKIAILATGNELVEAGHNRGKDQVFDVNRHVISALCRELGAEPLDLGIAGDDAEEITAKLEKGLAADAVITTGGTSVGASDLVPEMASKLGKPGVIVHGVAMRPAMPTALAIVKGKPVVILSGNPVAAMIGFEVFARPLICRLSGLDREESRPLLNARMTRKIVTALGRKTFVRVRVLRKDGEFLAEPVSAKGSGVITTMTRANGYVVVPENREGLAKGEAVVVHLFDTVDGVGFDV
jgi:molybdopterin molybdotransferase